jgi:hypothetical protein
MTSILKVDQLQDSGGNAIITSDGSGTITAGAVTNTPAFYVKLSATQTGVAHNTYTKVNFDTADINLQSAFDITTNNRFIVPSGYAGKYFFLGHITIFGGGAADVNLARTAIYKNGTIINATTLNAGGTAFFDYTNTSTAITLDLSVNDYVELFGYVAHGSSGNSQFMSSYGSTATYFQGYKLGA